MTQCSQRSDKCSGYVRSEYQPSHQMYWLNSDYTRTQSRNKNSQTPKKPRKNTRNHFHVSSIYPLPQIRINRGTHRKCLHISTFFTPLFSLSHRTPNAPNAPSLCTCTHSKTREADQSPRGERKSRITRRWCQTNQPCIITTPNIGAYKIPYLQT